MGARKLASRMFERLWNRRSLGHIVIKFYPQGREASITVSPTLSVLSRRYWHWLYLQHLAESLAGIGETQERVRLIVAARALAEDFVSRSYWPQVIGKGMPDAGAGAASIVPERAGGVALTARAVQRGDGMPTMRLTSSPAQAKERIASANLVLLVHVMKGASHPLEQYELFRKIALFTDYCERAGCPRERTKLRGGVLYSVVQADVTEVAAPRRSIRPQVSVSTPQPSQIVRRRRGVPLDPGRSRVLPAAGLFRAGLGSSRAGLAALRSRLVSVGAGIGALRASLASLRARIASFRGVLAGPDPFWKRSSAAIAAAVVVWVGLMAAAFFVPHRGGPVQAPQPMAGSPSGPPHVALTIPDRKDDRQQARVPFTVPGPSERVSRGATRSSAAAVAQRPAPTPDREQSDQPKFRVVSGTLALNVAEHRSKVLAEQGVDAFVKERAGKLGRLQYGAYRSKESAEEDARHLRAQGYTAIVIPW